jgi:hypothetical protein
MRESLGGLQAGKAGPRPNEYEIDGNCKAEKRRQGRPVLGESAPPFLLHISVMLNNSDLTVE